MGLLRPVSSTSEATARGLSGLFGQFHKTCSRKFGRGVDIRRGPGSWLRLDFGPFTCSLEFTRRKERDGGGGHAQLFWPAAIGATKNPPARREPWRIYATGNRCAGLGRAGPHPVARVGAVISKLSDNPLGPGPLGGCLGDWTGTIGKREGWIPD